MYIFTIIFSQSSKKKTKKQAKSQTIYYSLKDIYRTNFMNALAFSRTPSLHILVA